MISDKTLTYYQPMFYFDDGTNIEYGSTPSELYDFQAFPSREECEQWLENNGYNPKDFVINKYHDDDIEDVTLLDGEGNPYPKIEELSDNELYDIILDEVCFIYGVMEYCDDEGNCFCDCNAVEGRKEGESEDVYKDRLYALAQDFVSKAIAHIEKDSEYNFTNYCGNPEVEWYDDVRDDVVNTLFGWFTAPKPEPAN